jgi:glycosyltransferase involved in cell wall biosynthesis
MSCSLPVFATPKSLVGLDYAIPGKNILVFDKEILVSEVNEKLFNDILMNNISLNARETVEEFYSHQVHQKGILKFLSSVLGRPFQMHLSE